MVNLIKKVKFIVCLQVILFGTAMYAAAVSDNDGSAFITKAEFDSLKNDFQSQIDLYNSSIDSKIDTAIAQYLSGIKVATTERLSNATSKLKYPVYIKMSNKGIFDCDYFNDNSYAKIWRPGYNLALTNTRNSETTVWTGDYAGNYPETNFLSLIVNSDGTGLIDGCTKILKASLNINSITAYRSTANYGCHGDAGNPQRIGVKIAPSSWVATETSVNPYTMPLDNNYGLNWTLGNGVTTMPFIVGCSMNWNSTALVTASHGTTYPYQKIHAAHVQARTTFGDKYSDNVTTEIGTFNTIINYNPTYGENDHVYSLPDGKLYVTNNYYQTKVLLNYADLRPCWSVGDTKSHTTCNKGFNLVIDGGFTIEPVGFGNTSRANKYKSLWKTKDLYYNVTVPNTKEVVKQNMTKGILLTDMPSSDLNWCSVEFNIDLTKYDSTAEANLPKIVLSNSEIGDASSSTEQNKCLDIYEDERCSESLKSKVKTLKSGNNKFYLKAPEKNSKLYYKIFFNNSYTGSVIVNDPVVTVEVSS